eukprot:491442_1
MLKESEHKHEKEMRKVQNENLKLQSQLKEMQILQDENNRLQNMMLQKTEEKQQSVFISFNEACSEDTTFQCSLIFTTYGKLSHTFLIEETTNLVVKDLYHA